jgi:cytidyltransferase-like protein
MFRFWASRYCSLLCWIDRIGHAGAIVQAKRMGKYLVVGVHSDEEITINKGPPVMSLEERYQLS